NGEETMKILVAVMLTLLGVSPSLAQTNCTPKLGHPPLARKGMLIAAINPTVAPIQYIDDDGNIVGLDVDLGNAIAERLCLKMDFQSTQFATMIPALKEGRIDLINSFMFYTPERAAQVMMVPYGASALAIVVQKKNPDEIKGPEYFSGKSFAVELGTVDLTDAQAANQALEKAGKPPIEIHTFDTYATVLQALASGQVQGAFIGTEQAFYYRKKGLDFFRIALTGYDPHAEALAFKDPALAQAVVQVMNEMHADGTMDKIFKPYGHCLLPGPYKVMTGPFPKPNCPPQTQ
ncbi:MAG: ABC transporter substrate-binding protein, partial [Acetobacteraceae bacterium]